MEKERKLLIITKYLSILVISVLILFYAGYIQPLHSFKAVLRSSLILIILCGGLLYLVFTLVEYYYRKIFDYNSYIKRFHEFQLKALPTMTVDEISLKTLDVLGKIFKANFSVFLINDDELRKFAKNNEFVINLG